MRSLLKHASARDGLSDGPDVKTKTHVMEVMKQMYPMKWRIPDDFMERTHFERAVNRLHWQSSPGYPYLLNGTTNGDFFGYGTDRFETMKDYVWDLVSMRIRGGEPDHIRLFIKPEPLKLKKIEEERYRLISSVSVVDQILDHMLFDECNDAFLENHQNIPNKAGWSPYVGGWRMMPRPRKTAVDKKTWDWSVRVWLLEMDLQFRMEMCENMNERWKQLASMRYQQLFLNPTFITSGGLVLRQLQAGVMKSGCVNTISSNSSMQVMLHILVCLVLKIPIDWIMSLGDDTLQENVERMREYVDELEKYCHVKHYVNANEFAGFRFGKTIEPLYNGKHAFQLSHLDEKYLNEVSRSYVLMYHRSVDAEFIRKLFTDLGAEVPSREFCDLVYDGC